MQRPVFAVAAALALALPGASSADEHQNRDYDHKPEAQDFIHGAPEVPSEAWTLAAGGRIYDNWWDALDREKPEGTNPAYPVSVNKEQSGPGTWRCKECHGWDYLGKDGIYSKGGHFTGIKGINGAIGKPVEEIGKTLRDANHPYTTEMITDEEIQRVAAFVSRGQVDMRSFIDYETRTVNTGDKERGRAIFQTTCAACHGFDGRLIDWGEDGAHNYVGTEAAELPDEVMNKILNAHTGVQMINLRAFPLSDAIDVLAYAATLPLEPPTE
jgi:thiosulfate dehydrogenase